MRRPIKVLVAMLAVVAIAAVVGCAKEAEEPKLQPKVAPPAVSQAGVLKAGVDLETPPFAGEDQGQKAGIDIDVAAALAEKLGLTVEYVSVAPSEVATALAEGKIDVALSVPITTADLTRVAIAGTYLTDGPGIYLPASGDASAPADMTLETLTANPVAAQTSSESFWLLKADRGEESIAAAESLRGALEAVASGQAPAAVGSVVVASYILKDLPKVRYAGQAGSASPLGVAAAAENTTLADAVRSALDGLAADGVLDSIQNKWVGELPELKVADTTEDGSAPAVP